MRGNGWLVLIAGATALACAGSHPRGPVVRLDSTTRDSAGTTVLTLSKSPDAAAAGDVSAVELAPDLDLGGGQRDGFNIVADVATFRDGAIAVLDLVDCDVALFDSTGALVRRFGRKGDGPGEFRFPVALSAVGPDLIVIEADPTRAFTVFDTTGAVVETAPAPVAGDWAAMARRNPTLARNGANAREASGSEDVTLRLSAGGDSTFIVTLSPDETATHWADGRATAVAVQFDLRGRVLDTVAALSSAPRLHSTVALRGGRGRMTVPYATIPIFAPRALVAVGGGWTATSVGDTGAVDIDREGRRAALRIDWRGARQAISQSNRLEVGHWLLRAAIAGSEQARSTAAKMSASQRDAAEQQFLQRISFADSIPQITAMYGAGHCLWLAGFAPRDYVDGTSHTWISIDVTHDTIGTVVRIPRVGARVRHIDRRAIYATYFDADGVEHVERYPLPRSACN